MGLFDIFKKGKGNITKIKEIGLGEARSLVSGMKSECDRAFLGIGKRINSKTKNLISELEERISLLSKIDLKDKKEDGRLKRLSLQGLEEYIEQLRRLIINLERIDFESSEPKYIHEMDIIMNNFTKNSFKKYHRATILIGRELSEVNEIVNGFYKEINEIVKENREVIPRIQKIKKLEENDKLSKDTTSFLGTILENIKELEEEHSKILDELNETKKALESTKEGEKYKSLLEEKERINNEIFNIGKEITRIGSKINLKEIAKRVHGFAKNQELAKKYRENFLRALEEDKDLELIEILSTEEKSLIENNLRNLKDKRARLINKNSSFNPEEIINPIENKLSRSRDRLNEIVGKIDLEKKKKDRFEEKSSELRDESIRLIEAILEDVRVVG